MASGSVYRRRDGRWCGEVVLDGKRRYVYGKSKREAKDNLLRLIAAGRAAARNQGTVGTHITRYVADVQHTHDGRTYERYEGIARLHLLPAIGHIRLDRLTVDHCATLQSDLLTRLSPRSVKLAMGLLRGVLGPGSVAHAVRPPRLPPARSRALSVDEARRLLGACRTDHERLLLWLTLGLGLRLGEVCGLRVGDVRSDHIVIAQQLQRRRRDAGQLSYTVKPPKYNSARVLPLVGDVKQVVERQIREHAPGDFLLGPGSRPAPLRTVQYRVHLLAQRAGVAAVRLHDLRHSANTFLAAAGVDAKTRMLILGHRSPSVHADYTHPDAAMLREATESLSKLLSKLP